MNMMQAAPKAGAAGVRLVDDLPELSALQEPDCAAAIWHRHMPQAFSTWINALPVDQLPRARVVLRPHDVAQTLSDLCTKAGMPDRMERRWFEEDVAQMSASFAAIMDAPYLRLRLDVIETNACRKFHIDAIKARLICTYRGTATQYGNGSREIGPSEIFTLETGSPMVMRGTRWPEHPSAALLHRSPPIEGTGETRLVLVLDPVETMDDC